MDTTAAEAAGIRVPSAADRVYRLVKDAIISRRFTAAELLAEGQLAEELGVSRTPVREGLLRLEAEGLVQLLPKRGALVVPVTPAEMADVIETRRLVEEHAVRAVIRRQVPPLLLESLTGQLVGMRRAMSRRDRAAYVAADRAFHAEIVRAAGNAILFSLYGSLRDRQLRMGAANLLDPEEGGLDLARMRTTINEHQAILDGLARGSVRAAVAAVSHHLDGTERLLGKPR
ncbi:MAG: GntR family transcriptional regulator [Actinomycetota bacterium]|nr:GntR family transcriptional regulator [Actinomycetota bacterium]